MSTQRIHADRQSRSLLMAVGTSVIIALGASASAQDPHAQEPITKGGLPEGHPSVSTPRSSADALPPVPSGSGTGTAALKWQAPSGWTEEQPSSSMRRAQYRVPGSGGEGECVVFYFGPGQGGEPMANARRWAQQFIQPDGRPSTEVMETEELQIGSIEVLWVEVTGTYSGGMTMGPASPPRPDAMLLGAIAQGGDANWFFKLTGPEKTLRENEAAFRAMIESLRPGEAEG